MTRRRWILILLAAIFGPIGIVAYAISLYFLLGLVVSNGWAGFWAVIVTLVMILAVIVVAAFYDNIRREEDSKAVELEKQRIGGNKEETELEQNNERPHGQE